MKVNIPDKCLENWNKMTVNEKGRFCQNCQKTVVDFTQMSNTQIKDYFLERQGQKLCGRFKTDQLDRDIPTFIAPKKRLSILPKIAASALLFAGINQFSQSQININADKQKQRTTLETTKSQKETSKTIIHGKITDLASRVIPNAFIHSESLSKYSYSDNLGHFSFEIPENYNKEQVTLRFAKKGYQDVKLTYLLTQTKQGALKILMTSNIEAEAFQTDSKPPNPYNYPMGIIVVSSHPSEGDIQATENDIQATERPSFLKRMWNSIKSEVSNFYNIIKNKFKK